MFAVHFSKPSVLKICWSEWLEEQTSAWFDSVERNPNQEQVGPFNELLKQRDIPELMIAALYSKQQKRKRFALLFFFSKTGKGYYDITLTH